MSARERLAEAVWGNNNLTYEEADQLIDAYAHELAERTRSQKIRNPEGEVEEHVNWVIDGLADDIAPQQRCDMREAHTAHRWTKGGVAYVCKTVVLNSGE